MKFVASRLHREFVSVYDVMMVYQVPGGNIFLSFLKLDHIWGNFGKILFFPPWRLKTLRKISS